MDDHTLSYFDDCVGYRPAERALFNRLDNVDVSVLYEASYLDILYHSSIERYIVSRYFRGKFTVKDIKSMIYKLHNECITFVLVRIMNALARKSQPLHQMLKICRGLVDKYGDVIDCDSLFIPYGTYNDVKYCLDYKKNRIVDFIPFNFGLAAGVSRTRVIVLLRYYVKYGISHEIILSKIQSGATSLELRDVIRECCELDSKL